MLLRSSALGCSLAASPLVTPLAFANAPWQGRLVVIILRGGMDGLDVVRPYGDPAFAALRPRLNEGPLGHDLDGYFALHPALASLVPLWQRRELGFVHAVSTPYRDKRSHFDGQDMLEAGTNALQGGVRDGWLNRLLQEVPELETDVAYAIGTTELQVLEGAAPVANWAPEANLRLSPQALRLASLVMERDPAMHAALAEAEVLAQATDEGSQRGRAHRQVAQFAANRLRGDTRIAAFSLNGWDTHRAQARNLSRSLNRLSETLLTLERRLGAVWGQTTVVAMTEFGRTARENGTSGTDHGTGGLMMLAGGAVNGGQVFGIWPGVDDQALYQGRDLLPTADVRAPMAEVLQGLTGVNQPVLETRVFPGLQMGPPLGVLR